MALVPGTFLFMSSRWFAYVSETEECLLEDVLITPVSSTSVFQCQDIAMLVTTRGPLSCETSS